MGDDNLFSDSGDDVAPKCDACGESPVVKTQRGWALGKVCLRSYRSMEAMAKARDDHVGFKSLVDVEDRSAAMHTVRNRTESGARSHQQRSQFKSSLKDTPLMFLLGGGP